MKTKSKAHAYTVELSIFGTMDPDIVTAETGLHPCAVRRAEIDQERKILHKSRWIYNGVGESGAYEWDTLEEGLQFVLGARVWLHGRLQEIWRDRAGHLVVRTFPKQL